MKLDTYQQETDKTAIYKETCEGFSEKLAYLISGLTSEIGKVNGKYSKFLRNDMNKLQFANDIIGELGDCLWFIAQLALLFGLSLSFVALHNIKKLSSRKKKK